MFTRSLGSNCAVWSRAPPRLTVPQPIPFNRPSPYHCSPWYIDELESHISQVSSAYFRKIALSGSIVHFNNFVAGYPFTMASILDLPNELMDPILSVSCPSDISRLSLVNKSLHALLSPRIYEKIEWHWDDDTRPPPFHLLLRTLLRNPTLARHIRSLSLRGSGLVPVNCHWVMWPYEHVEYHEYHPGDRGAWQPIERARSIPLGSTFSETEMHEVQQLVKNIYRPSPSIWLREFARGNVDVLVALLLSRMNALVSLKLGFYYVYHSQFIPAILRHMAIDRSGACAFPILESVQLAMDRPEMDVFPWLNIDLLRAFFFLPEM